MRSLIIPQVDRVNKSRICHKFKLVVWDRTDKRTKYKLRVDANGYHSRIKTKDHRVQLDKTELPLEFKDLSPEAFVDTDTETLLNITSRRGQEAQGQLVAYQLEIERHQPRVFTFSVQIKGTNVHHCYKGF